MPTEGAPGGAAQRAGSWLGEVAASPWFAYGSILAIQAKVLWGIWSHRDLSAGDTSHYFADAASWADHRTVDPLFSPLYTSFWGSLKWIFQDPYAVTIAHRVVIAVAVTLLVLAVLRRLVSPGIAWVLAAWWAVLPVNYDTLNEVHLFSLIPVLVAAWVALRWSGRGMRAAVFGILLGSAILQRNEIIVAALLWLVVCAAYEWRSRRAAEQGPREPVARVLTPFGIATVVVALLTVLALWRSRSDLSAEEWIDRAQTKQDLALCQHYAVGYQQRHHADTAIGWLHCERFMDRDFDSKTPSFFDALASNPSAMGTHFRWNATLAAYEPQLALFDRTSGSDFHDPDYVPVRTGSALALVGSLIVLAFVLLGLRLLWVERRRWWETWIAPRAWGWALLGCAAALGIWVAITTHPRPAYLFPLNFVLFCSLGMCAMGIAGRWPSLKRLGGAIPVAALLALLLVPNHYRSGYSNPLYGPGRGAAAMVSRLEPYRDDLQGQDRKLLGPYAFEACDYLVPEDPCMGAPGGLTPLGDPNPAAALDRMGVDWIYANEMTLTDPTFRRVLRKLQGAGWRRIAPAEPGEGWMLLERSA